MVDMTGIRLLIVDADTAYASYLNDYFSTKHKLEIVGMAGDGLRALQLARTQKPNLVLMDPLLPALDGLTLMKSMKKLKQPPVIVCQSRCYTDLSIEIARRNGASYYAFKPLNSDSLASILIDCAETAAHNRELEAAQREISQDEDLYRHIYSIMHELGFSAKHNGSRYIAESVAMAVESPLVLHNLNTGLYRRLSDQLNISKDCIERSIRTSIARANGDGKLEEKIGEKPTNKACIRYILHQIKPNL